MENVEAKDIRRHKREDRVGVVGAANALNASDTVAQQRWTEIITPKSNVFDLRLNEVWKYKDLMFLFVKRDFAAQFKQTVLGPFWHLIQPLFTTLIFFILFNNFAKIPTNGIPPMLFYMSSITIWNYFALCLTNTSNTFVSNAGIFGKVYFPRLILPLATVTSNLVKLGIQVGLMCSLILYFVLAKDFHINFGLHNLLIPVIVVIMAGLGLGLGIVISSLTTKYRDFNVLITFGVQLLMYLTPVAYPLSFVEQSKFKFFVKINPLSSLVEGFRYAVFGSGTFNTGLFLYSIGFMMVSLLIGVILFNKVERSFMDTV